MDPTIPVGAALLLDFVYATDAVATSAVTVIMTGAAYWLDGH